MSQEVGKWLIVIGFACVIIGIIFYFSGNKLSFLGRLPGDIRVERENFRFYFPITTMIILSILLSIIIRLIGMWRS